MHPTPFEDLNQVLAELVDQVREILGDSVIGIYLQGSLAGPDRDRHSDVDFVVIVERPIDQAAAQKLQEMHAAFVDQPLYWAQHLEGSYFTADHIRRLDGSFPAPLYVDNGSRELMRDRHDDTLVVRWELREQGIPLCGPDIKTLVDPISEVALRAEVYQTLSDWAAEILAEPKRLENSWVQMFVVLSTCRMLQTLHTGRIGSKRAAVAWGKTQLDAKWQRLIDRAWARRENQYAQVQQRADALDVAETPAFLREMLARAQALDGG